MDEGEPKLAELVEKITTRISTSLVLAGAIIGLGVYAGRPATPRYEAVALGDKVVRVDTRSGAMIACDAAAHCTTIYKRGGAITISVSPDKEKAPAPKAIPAPSPVPAPAAR
jgi:hypothetical protein